MIENFSAYIQKLAEINYLNREESPEGQSPPKTTEITVDDLASYLIYVCKLLGYDTLPIHESILPVKGNFRGSTNQVISENESRVKRNLYKLLMTIAQKDLNNLLAVSFYGKGSNKFRDFADKEKALSILKLIVYNIPPHAIIYLLSNTEIPPAVGFILHTATLITTGFIGFNQHRNTEDAMQGYDGYKQITEQLAPVLFDANILQQPRNSIKNKKNIYRELPTLAPSNFMVNNLNSGFYHLPVPDPHLNMTAALKTLSEPAKRNLALGPLFYGLPLLHDDRETAKAKFAKYGLGNWLIDFMQRYLHPDDPDAQALLGLGSMPKTDIKSMGAFKDVTNANPEAPSILQISAARTILSLAEHKSLEQFTEALNFDKDGNDNVLLQLLLMITGLKTASTVVNKALQNEYVRIFQLNVEKYSKGVENTNKFIGIICSKIFDILNKYLNYTTATPEKKYEYISINKINILFIVLKWVATECPDKSQQFANFLDNIYLPNTENKDLPNIYFLSRINELYNDLNTLPSVYKAQLESIMSLEKRAVDKTNRADCKEIDRTNLLLYFLRTAVSRTENVDTYLNYFSVRLNAILLEISIKSRDTLNQRQISNLAHEMQLIINELKKILKPGKYVLDDQTTRKIQEICSIYELSSIRV